MPGRRASRMRASPTGPVESILEVGLSSDLSQRFEDLVARAADIRGYL